MSTNIGITVPVSIACVFFHLAAIRAELICACVKPVIDEGTIIFGLSHIQIPLASITDRSGLTIPIAVRAMSAIFATSMGSKSKEESSQG
jgi:hypothetical protein